MAAIHTEVFRMRVPAGMLARARQRAERKGMTVSELVRHALRSELGDA